MEAISNPKLEVGDLKAVAAFSQDYNLTSVIDATFTPPVNFRPASIGFNIVLHSATKYYNGHSDIVAGVVAGSKDSIAKVSARQALKLQHVKALQLCKIVSLCVMRYYHRDAGMWLAHFISFLICHAVSMQGKK